MSLGKDVPSQIQDEKLNSFDDLEAKLNWIALMIVCEFFLTELPDSYVNKGMLSVPVCRKEKEKNVECKQ